MHVFVTGASGWIGSALVPELLTAGHQVTGLARSDASAAALTAAGVDVARGTLDDPDVLREAAAAADGVVHLAFRHDLAFSGNFETAADSDRNALNAFGEALAGTGKPLVVASVYPGTPGRVTTEQDGPDAEAAALMGPGPQVRLAIARMVLDLAERGIRPSLVRLPPTVHGQGDPWFMASLVGVAREKGVSAYIGDGANRWPAVHRLDAAVLFRLAVESAPAGSILHAIDDEGVPLRDIADVIGRHLAVPVASRSPEEAGEHFGWLEHIVAADIRVSSARTRELTGWQPTHQGLIEDLEKGHYFDQ